ncbi:MAG: formylglycine-generating enzyme family protein [Terriglobales bacterium]
MKMLTRTLQLLLLLLLQAAFVLGRPARAGGDQRGGEMAAVPGGTFEIGIDAAEVPRLKSVFGINSARLFEPEMPRHTVTIDSFYLDKYPVTNAQFRKFIDVNPEWRPERIAGNLHNGNYLKQRTDAEAPVGKPDHPVVNVSWYAAVAYCRWAGKRLPTEAEWERGARGGLTGIYPWGDQPVDKSRANYSGSGIGTTTTVGTYPANGYGLYDMAGNVWQFVADEWQSYPAAAQENPMAGGDRFTDGTSFLEVKTRRVIRGGSWGGDPINLWVEYRDSHPPNGAQEFVGFRCAK